VIVSIPLETLAGGEGTVHGVRIEGFDLAIFKEQDQYYAVEDKCPHRGGKFSEGGEVANGRLVCPLHHFKFELKNGRCLMPKHLKLRKFPVSREGDVLKVDLQVQQDAPRPV
jgi:nitrite reductase/ring-hydroxylating ferredoxin subunit